MIWYNKKIELKCFKKWTCLKIITPVNIMITFLHTLWVGEIWCVCVGNKFNWIGRSPVQLYFRGEGEHLPATPHWHIIYSHFVHDLHALHASWHLSTLSVESWTSSWISGLNHIWNSLIIISEILAPQIQLQIQVKFE